MKLNKREIQAFDTLETILHELRYSEDKNEEIPISTSDYNAVKEVFGIDLKECTFYKKNVKKFVKGKDGKHLSFWPPVAYWKVYATRYGYFPFQIKELKPIELEKKEDYDK